MTNLVNLALTYTNLAVQLMVGDANYYVEKLHLPEPMPLQASNLQTSIVLGTSIKMSGEIRTKKLKFKFEQGYFTSLRRIDLFEPETPGDFDPPKPISDAQVKAAALGYLAALSFDTNQIGQHYSLQIAKAPFGGDFMVYPSTIRKAPPIAKAEWREKEGHTRDLRYQFGEIKVQILTTTGECVGLTVSPGSNEPNLIALRCERMIITNAVDVAVPLYASGLVTTDCYDETVPPTVVNAMVHAAHDKMRAQLGTNQPKCYLVSDNLNASSQVQAELKRLHTDAPFTGITTHWRDDLPFARDKMDTVARGKRGIQIVAIGGRSEIELLVAENPKRLDLRNVPEESWQRLQNQHNSYLGEEAARFLSKIQLGSASPGLLLLLAHPSTGPDSSLTYALEKLAGERAKIIRLPDNFRHHGNGQTYLNGTNLENAFTVLQFKGPMPVRLASSRRDQGYFDWDCIQPIVKFPEFSAHPLEQVTRYVGSPTIESMRRAERVEAFRITRDMENKFPDAKRWEEYKLIGQGPDQNNAFARELTEALVNEKDGFGFAKRCIFDPGIVFRFWSGKEMVKVTICFGCNDLIIESYDATGKSATSIGFDFGANRSRLLELCREVFPNDADLAKLANEH